MRVAARGIAWTLLLAAASPSFAAGQNCRTIRALTNADGREFADLRIGLGPGAGVSLRTGNGRPDIAEASECEVSGEGDMKDLSCRWSFPDHAGATAFFDPLLARIQSCLPAGLPTAGIETRTPGWLVMRRNEALVTTEYTQTRVELALIELSRQANADAPASSDYTVQLTVEFEQGD